MSINPSPQIVIKVSKYCNLRCDYCYEFPHLGDKTRMSLDNVRAMFVNIKSCIKDLGIEDVDFIWHGGEPFLVPIEFYERAGLLQKELFANELKYVNSVQTNLTVLTDRHIAFLKGGFFADIGVSFDVYGDQRVDAKGRGRTEIVLANMQKLVDHQVRFGAIAVLAQNTLATVKQIYRFFDDLHVSHRMLAYYRSVGGGQSKRHGLTPDELVSAYKDLFHEWLGSETATTVDPIDDYVRYAVRHVSNVRGAPYDRSVCERVFIVDVNGDVYNVVESYEPEFCYGNLFQAPFSEVVASEARYRSSALAQERMQRFCHRCPYFGACPGDFVANATNVERELLEASRCPVRAMLDHIVDVFERTDLKEFILKTHSAGAKAEERPALSVA